MKTRYCPNCGHDTAQEKGLFLVKNGKAVKIPKTRFSIGLEGFTCLTCGRILISITEVKVFEFEDPWKAHSKV